MLVENLLSVTSYAPGPALRPPCATAAASMLWTQTSPISRQSVRLIVRWRRWARVRMRCELVERWATTAVSGTSARKERWSSGNVS